MSNSISIVIDTTGTAILQMVFNDLQVYPNPTKDVFQLSLNEELSSIRMYDTFGKLVKEFNAKSTLIDVSDLTAGVYFLEIANAEKRSTIKIVKQ